MPQGLIIVESPAKARTLKRFLGDRYDVRASMGHVRDLPERELAVDVEHGFEPRYEVVDDRAGVIKELQTGTFQTIVGPITLKDNLYTQPWYVGQWQNGEYYGVGPASKAGARAIVFPKPPWPAQQ